MATLRSTSSGAPADISVADIQSNPQLAKLWSFLTGGGLTAPSNDNPYALMDALKAAGIPVPAGMVPYASASGVIFLPGDQSRHYGPVSLGAGGGFQAPGRPSGALREDTGPLGGNVSQPSFGGGTLDPVFGPATSGGASDGGYGTGGLPGATLPGVQGPSLFGGSPSDPFIGPPNVTLNPGAGGGSSNTSNTKTQNPLGLSDLLKLGGLSGGLGLLGSLLSSNGQQRKPFDNVNVEPNINGLLQGIPELGGALTAKANQPVSLRSSFAQNVPGLSGTDPALQDPSLLSLPGLNLPNAFAPAAPKGDEVVQALTPFTQPRRVR